MSGSENISGIPDYEMNSSNWSVPLQAFEVVSIILLVLVSWLFLSMIVYGTKTKRWFKKPGTSSLNSGIIYCTCTVAVMVTIPRFAVTEYIYILPRLNNKMELCNFICDVDNLLYSTSMYGTYVFMWLLQRKIYTHPYVKPKIGKAINWFSRLFGLLLAVIAIGLTLTYVMLNSYTGQKHACVMDITESNTVLGGMGKNILVVSCLVVSQGTILFLCIYPVIRVKFDLGNGATDSLEDSVFTDAADVTQKSDKMRQLIKSCFRREQKIVKSPIENAARRAMIGGMIMVLTDVLALTTAFMALPAEAPVALRQTLYDIANLVNLFCIISSLGLAPKILMIFCPNCTEVIRRRTRTSNVFEYGLNDYASNRSEGAVGNKVSPQEH